MENYYSATNVMKKSITIACTRTAVSVTPFAKRKAAKDAPLTASCDAGVRFKRNVLKYMNISV